MDTVIRATAAITPHPKAEPIQGRSIKDPLRKVINNRKAPPGRAIRDLATGGLATRLRFTRANPTLANPTLAKPTLARATRRQATKGRRRRPDLIGASRHGHLRSAARDVHRTPGNTCRAAIGKFVVFALRAVSHMAAQIVSDRCVAIAVSDGPFAPRERNHLRLRRVSPSVVAAVTSRRPWIAVIALLSIHGTC